MSSGSSLRPWQLTILILGTYALAALLLALAYSPRVLVPGAQGFLGYTAAPATYQGRSAHRITAFEPSSPLPATGVKAGDLIVTPPRGTFRAGELVHLGIVHDNVLRDVEVRAVPFSPLFPPALNALDLATNVLFVAFAFTIAARRWRDLGALLLAAIFLVGAGGRFPYVLPARNLASFVGWWSATCSVLGLPLLAYFFLVFDGGYQSRSRTRIARALATLGTLAATWGLVMAPYYFGTGWPFTEFLSSGVRPALQFAGVILCVVASRDCWRHADAERRERLRWLLVAFGIALANFCVLAAYFAGLLTESTRTAVAVAIIDTVAAVSCLIVLTYAILRHRVVDVGFVISRALVFALFSGALLVCFGIAEWLLDHFVQFGKRESSMLVDGVIALALFIAFHRMRDSIERVVERIFFRSWHVKEEALQRFLDMASHYSQPASLSEALVAATDAYADSCGSGLYQRTQDGRFVLEHSTLGTLPRELAADAPVIVESKTYGEPLHVTTQHALDARLAFPMLRRSELVGLLVVGPKRGKEVYRPDEIDNLARATRQVSADLYALRLDQLEQRQRELEQQNAGLRQGLQALHRASEAVD